MKQLIFAVVLGVTVATGRADTPGSGSRVDYVLQPLDLLRVVVFQEPDLERQVRISQEYSINLPLIGSIDLRGKTPRQAEEIIRDRYDADFLKNPQINVTVLEYSQRTVQVLGAVNSPGAIALPPEQQIDIVEAIARAGGHARIADLRKVRLKRLAADGKTENVIIVNVDEMMKGATGERLIMQKGDVISVPERIL
jgi:polysaccharide export outer membrane protein